MSGDDSKLNRDQDCRISAIDMLRALDNFLGVEAMYQLKRIAINFGIAEGSASGIGKDIVNFTVYQGDETETDQSIPRVKILHRI